MTSLRGVALFVLAMAAAVPASEQAPPAEPQVFRSTADLVPLFVTVTDKSDRLVSGLPREGFEVRDNGKPQPLTLFDNRPQPIRVIALMDIAGSVSRTASILKTACAEFFLQLGTGDLARIGVVGRSVNYSSEFTRSTAQLLAALPSTTPSGVPMPLWNAVDSAITLFETAPPGRRVILVFSAGLMGSAQYGEKALSVDDVTERARREDVMIYGVGIKTAITPIGPGRGGSLGAATPSSTPDRGLGRAAEATGGALFELRGSDDLGQTFARVAAELHHQYLLGFAPSARDGKTHKIEVRLNRSDLKARARKAYDAPRK
jgi:Ca-activated chloride channel family protein